MLELEPELEILLPVHPNPNVAGPVHQILGDLPRVHLAPPLSYPDLVSALKRCALVLTDSGGIQEEAPALGKPVLVARSTTERPEAVDAGVAELVGTDPLRIIERVRRTAERFRCLRTDGKRPLSLWRPAKLRPELATFFPTALALRGVHTPRRPPS